MDQRQTHQAYRWCGGAVGVVLAVSLASAVPSICQATPFQATGFKVGEVTDTTAVIWTRPTRNAKPNRPDAPMVKLDLGEPDKSAVRDRQHVRDKHRKVLAIVYPDGMTVADIRNAVPGAPGQVRVLYKKDGAAQWLKTEWRAVEAHRDFTRQFLLENLVPNAQYVLRVESRSGQVGPAGQSLNGRFRTAPAAGDAARVVFTVVTGQSFGDQDAPGGGYKSYRAMLKLDPSFFVHTGDIVYYDRLAKSVGLARYHWQRTYSLPTNVKFHCQVASYFIKDDHDTWQNDCWPGMQRDNMKDFTFEQGLAVFCEQVPMGKLTYRTRRWGKDLQIWLVEGRDYRSPNTMPDGPAKTIWGATQKAWFKRTVQESDATFRVLISPTPLVGPDRPSKNDNHANKGFTHEGNELRRFIAGQKNMAIVCGDRHWQYISVDPDTGAREYSCGPISDEHAGGWENSMRRKAHRYLNVVGGFLSATVERRGGKATLTFRHHSPDGNVLNEDRLIAQ
jgi:alkaline phosphatase D